MYFSNLEGLIPIYYLDSKFLCNIIILNERSPEYHHGNTSLASSTKDSHQWAKATCQTPMCSVLCNFITTKNGIQISYILKGIFLEKKKTENDSF